MSSNLPTYATAANSPMTFGERRLVCKAGAVASVGKKTDTVRQPSSLEAILNRSALSLFLFGSVFAGILMISKAFLLPSVTTVEVAGEVRDAQQIKEYHSALSAQILSKQKQRDALVLPLSGGTYRMLTDVRSTQMSLHSIQSALREVQSSFQTEEGEHRVSYAFLSYTPGSKKVAVRGAIVHAGPQSMTVLAQFLEELRDHPLIASFDNPPFERLTDAQGKFYSPFTLHLVLSHD